MHCRMNGAKVPGFPLPVSYAFWHLQSCRSFRVEGFEGQVMPEHISR